MKQNLLFLRDGKILDMGTDADAKKWGNRIIGAVYGFVGGWLLILILVQLTK